MMPCPAGRAILAVVVAALLAIPAAAAQSVDDFFNGRTMTWIVGAPADGSHALYARTLAPYFAMHLPGQPSIIIQYDALDNGRHAATHLAEAAPRDGSVIGMTLRHLPLLRLLQAEGITFDAVKWNWIGNVASMRGVMVLSRAAPVSTFKQAIKTEIVMGVASLGSVDRIDPTLANGVLGTRFRLVTGFRGVGRLLGAIRSGKIDGFAARWPDLKRRAGDWIRDGRIVIPVQTGLDADPDLPEIPVMWKLGRTRAGRAAMRLVATFSMFARALWAPPDVPADRVAALRGAFDRAVRDPGFSAAARRGGITVEPTGGMELARLMREAAKTRAPIIAIVRDALEIK